MAKKLPNVKTGDMRPKGETKVITANDPVNVGAHNESAAANPALAPKPGQKPAPAKVAPARKEIPADALKRAEKADQATKEWELVTGLLKQGKDRSAIAKETGLTYSRITFLKWHLDYGVDAIPGMPAYTKEKKDAAQARYLQDVEARKQAKAAG